MTAKRHALADLPGWPRLLSEDQAAAYVGVCVAIFKREVIAGVWPAPRISPVHTKTLWDRRALDERLDRRDGPTQPERGATLLRRAREWPA